MNTLSGIDREKPAPDTGEANNLEVHFTHGTYFRCGPAP